ncbi:MAG: Rpn family recombination-promoting nuclease/putative transposase [Bacteroidales bacterium]|nr:Rpn family recombination-promoting nuclease/putative transposase [Bacteroidales bacterium]
MSKYLNPKVDLTFKKVFGEHENLVKSLLNALLPLPEGMTIEKVEYLTSENVPENPAKKYSIVDVRCTDNKGRGFIVEMQNYWNKEFFSRTLFNAASMYSKQLAKGNPFEKLKEVYALALVNDEAFDYADDNGYMQEFYIINKKHTDDIHRDISLIFIELQKYKPKDRGSRAIKELWLRFLTEINEQTEKVDAVMLENPEISQALEIVERSAYSDGDLYAYEDYLLEVMTQRNSVVNARNEGEEIGFEKGEAKGREEGEKLGIEKSRKETAIAMLKKGLPVELIAEISQLSVEKIEKLKETL